MKKTPTWHIHISGQVQGVGFRPFVFQLAAKFGIVGWVNNSADGVHIEFNADEKNSQKFYNVVVENAPPLSQITSHCMKETSSVAYGDFKIALSTYEANRVLLISPDFGMCAHCRKEIGDKTNRRYHYAFTTCTQCGPRYSIITHLPYDRENTRMQPFSMCNDCTAEHIDPTDRRHFSQTNSCPRCAVVMRLFDNNQNIIEENQVKIISRIYDLWNEGKIVAIKGIGGYLLTCDATNATPIKALRQRKHRPSKPFALMFPDIVSLEKKVHFNAAEINELKNVAAPIVLFKLKEHEQTQLALNEIAPGLSKIGVMLPYSPLYHLLLQKFSRPVVATSGNITNSPIVYKDDIALNELNKIADYILVHNREIVASQDDSVVSFTLHSQQRIILRRARGYVPIYINKNLKLSLTCILAMGASMKSCFTLLHKKNIHISQYLGDVDNYDAQIAFDNTVRQFLKLFHAQPEIILVDKHPDYFTSKLGEILAKKWSCQLIHVQHHEAHLASVLGEHNLMDVAEPILGVIWDGTGYGHDGQIWGGEFFIYHQHAFSRINHFEYYNHFLGDKMAIEPRLSAFSLCYEIEEAKPILHQKFTPAEWNNYQKLIATNKLKTSSVGRIFDAVASLLGLIDKASYEGEAAMLLEQEALSYFRNGLDIPFSWLMNKEPEQSMSAKYILAQIVSKLGEGINTSEIAAWFHVQLVISIKTIASQNRCKKIGFSGGVFQNGLLVDLTIKILEKHQLYFNKELSPNDENISFGQVILYGIGVMSYEL